MLSVPKLKMKGDNHGITNISVNQQGHMWGVSSDGKIWFRQQKVQNSSWVNVFSKGDGEVNTVSVNDEGTVWHTSGRGKAFRAVMPEGYSSGIEHAANPWWYQFRRPTYPPWARIVVNSPQGDKAFAIDSSTGLVWAQQSNNNKTKWYLEKGSDSKQHKKMLNISAGKDGRIWGVGPMDNLYYKDTKDSNDQRNTKDWVYDDSIECTQVSATGDGRVCCLSNKNTIYVSYKVGVWAKLSGWKNIISVGCGNGGNICAVTKKKNVYCRDTKAAVKGRRRLNIFSH